MAARAHLVAHSVRRFHRQAYFSIPIVLSVFISKRPDFGFGWVIVAFVVFITACGATHVFGIWTLWFPDYAAEGAVKGITALASVATAMLARPRAIAGGITGTAGLLGGLAGLR